MPAASPHPPPTPIRATRPPAPLHLLRASRPPHHQSLTSGSEAGPGAVPGSEADASASATPRSTPTLLPPTPCRPPLSRATPRLLVWSRCRERVLHQCQILRTTRCPSSTRPTPLPRPILPPPACHRPLSRTAPHLHHLVLCQCRQSHHRSPDVGIGGGQPLSPPALLLPLTCPSPIPSLLPLLLPLPFASAAVRTSPQPPPPPRDANGPHTGVGGRQQLSRTSRPRVREGASHAWMHARMHACRRELWTCRRAATTARARECVCCEYVRCRECVLYRLDRCEWQ